MKETNNIMENALYDIYPLVEAYQKTYSYTALTWSFSDTFEVVNKNRRRTHEVIFGIIR